MVLSDKGIGVLSGLLYDETRKEIVLITAKILQRHGIKMNPTQLDPLSTSLITMWPDLKLSDIIVIFNRGAAGGWGKFSWGEFQYSEITGENGWCAKYELFKADVKSGLNKPLPHNNDYHRSHDEIMREMDADLARIRSAKEAKKAKTISDIPDLEKKKEEWEWEANLYEFDVEGYIEYQVKRLLTEMNKE